MVNAILSDQIFDYEISSKNDVIVCLCGHHRYLQKIFFQNTSESNNSFSIHHELYMNPGTRTGFHLYSKVARQSHTFSRSLRKVVAKSKSIASLVKFRCHRNDLMKNVTKSLQIKLFYEAKLVLIF